MFLIFGQWIGRLFEGPRPLVAYSVEIVGSLLGILLFASLSAAGAGPTVWFCVGAGLLILILPWRFQDWALAFVSCAAVVALTHGYASQFIWSPYYKIKTEPITKIFDRDSGMALERDDPIGHTVVVNNDYHQMMLDLRPRKSEHAFLSSWRRLYDAPYGKQEVLPPGPVLVVGAWHGKRRERGS